MENEQTSGYPIIIDGKTAGELKVTKSGLFTSFEGDCEYAEGILRLAVYGETEGYLGVMIPEGGRLRIKKRFSRTQLIGFPSSISHAGPAGQGAQTEFPPSVGTEMTPDETVQVFSEQSVSGEDSSAPGALSGETSYEVKEAVPEPASEPSNMERDAQACAVVADIGGIPCKLESLIAACEVLNGDDFPCEPDALSTACESARELKGAGTVMAEISPEPEVPIKQESGILSHEMDTIWIPEPNPWSLFVDQDMKLALKDVRGALTTSESQKVLLAIPESSTFIKSLITVDKVFEKRAIEGTEYLILIVNNGKIV